MTDADPTRPARGNRGAGESPLRGRTRHVLRPSEPPSESIPVVWTGPDGVDRETALSVIDLATRTVTKKIPVGDGPWGLALVNR